MTAIAMAVVLVVITVPTVWSHESGRRSRRRDEIRREVRTAVRSLHAQGRAITLLSVMGFLGVCRIEIDVADVLSALETQVREGCLGRSTMEGPSVRHRQTVLYSFVFPQMFSATADPEEQIVYEAVALFDRRRKPAYVSAVSDLTGLSVERTLKLLTELTRRGWLDEYKLPSANSDEVLFAYRRVPA